MKKIIYILIVIIAILACIPFVPSIYNKITKPLYKNYIDSREWYDHVDPANMEQVRGYCERREYNTDYYALVDFSIPSGKRRFFIYDLKNGKRVLSSYCMHGSGKGNTAAEPIFSNEFGSKCSCLGRFIMVGKGSSKKKNSIRLRGLDKTNSMAETRGILIHSARKVTLFHGQSKYIPLGSESYGCFTVSSECATKMMRIYENSTSKRPVLIYAKYK